MRTPLQPTQRRDSRLPVPKPGTPLSSLQTYPRNQPLSGSVMSIYEGQSCRKLFVDVGVTRTDKKGKHYPVFGMVRLLGPYATKKYTYGQKLIELYVDEVFPQQGRLVLSLTPVYKRPAVDAAGQPLPIKHLHELEIGMSLGNGTVVSITENYAFIDAGVVVLPDINKAKPTQQETDTQQPKKNPPRPRRLNGRLYRLDLLEKYALSTKHQTATTLSLLQPGDSLPVYIKDIHPLSNQYTLTLDPKMTREKATLLKEERKERQKLMKKKQDVDALLIGESRKGVITKLLPGGVKVGVGVKKTGYVSKESIEDIYGKEIRDLKKVLVVGGRMQVEVDEISEDGERIDLRCLEIYDQKEVAKKKKEEMNAKAQVVPQQQGQGKGQGKGKKVVVEVVEDGEESDDDFQYDDESDDENSKFGYDDEW